MKSRFILQEYNKVYPTGSNAGKLYGTAKIHKLPESGTVDQLPLRPIVSNIGTASHYLAKHLAKILAPLSKSEYTVQNTKDFVNFIKPQKIPFNYQLISFDVVSLFTNVPIDATIDIIIRRIYEFKEIDTRITKNEMRELILLCTKNVHFTFNDETFTQVDSMAMGSPLAPILANIFMAELERNLIPILKDHLSCWRRYVDDTICFIKNGSVEHVLSTLNNFHSSIKFTYETESGNKLSFLDVQLIRTGDNIETCVFRKPTNTDIYIHWNSFAPVQWKYSTLKTLVYHVYIVCSDNQHLESELNYLTKVFHNFSYLHWFITKVIYEVKNDFNKQIVPPTPHIKTTDSEKNNIRKPMMILPYAGEKGCTLIKPLKKNLQSVLPVNIQTCTVYTETKLSSQLRNIKNPTLFEE